MIENKCLSCRFYLQGKTWNIPPENYNHSNNNQYGTILIVDSYPNKIEDNSGNIFNSYQKCSKQFRQLLSYLESPYTIISALGCYPVVNGSEVKPTDKEIKYCSSIYLHKWIAENNPRVIVCLGPVAMKAVLQDRAPKTMKSILNSPVKLIESDPDSSDVIVTNHPAIYFKMDEASQMKIHLDVLATADDICMGNLKKKNIPYKEITTSAELLNILPTLRKKLYFDIENTGSKYAKDRATIWHPGNRLLCFSITDEYFGERRQFVFHGPVLKNTELLTNLFTGKIIVGHNIHYDIQTFYALTGIDLYEIVEDYDCTFAQIILTNSNRQGNSLKKLANCYDWSTPVRQAIEEHKLLISDLHKYINRITSRVTRKYKNLSATKKDIEDYQRAKKNKLYLRPLNSQDYGDVPMSILIPYNAEDTWQTAEVDEKVIAPLRKAGEISSLAYDIVKKEMKLIAYIERNGLDINLQRLNALTSLINERIRMYQEYLLSSDVVLRAILNSDPGVQEKLRMAGGKAKEFILKLISPKSKKFFEELARITGVLHLAFATVKSKKKTDSPTFDYDALLRMCGGLPDIDESLGDEYWTPWEKKTDYQKLWYHILQYRKLFDLNSKFIKEMKTYQINGKIKPTFILFKSDSFTSGSIGKDAGGGTGTGRLACKSPNCQQIKKDPALRWIFFPGEQYRFVEFDYKSIEPRIMAVVSGCKKFEEAFNRGFDLYQVIANEVYDLGVDLSLSDEEVKNSLNQVCPKNGKLRDTAKTSTLAIMYGESVRGFATRSKLPEKDVWDFFARFDQMFPEIKELRDTVRQQLINGDPIVSMFGRVKKYELPNAYDEKYNQKFSSILRKAFNFLIQSVANDVLLVRAYYVMEWIKSQGQDLQKNVNIVNIIHDSIVLRIHQDYLWTKPKIASILEDMTTMPIKINIPILVDEKTGRDLAENLGK